MVKPTILPVIRVERNGSELELSWDEFEVRLVKAGWNPIDAKREREAQERGNLGDCDGDLWL